MTTNEIITNSRVTVFNKYNDPILEGVVSDTTKTAIVITDDFGVENSILRKHITDCDPTEIRICISGASL